MSAENQRRKQDKILGMDERISRRDFLNSTLLASGGLLMSAVTPLQLLGRSRRLDRLRRRRRLQQIQWKYARGAGGGASHSRRRV